MNRLSLKQKVFQSDCKQTVVENSQLKPKTATHSDQNNFVTKESSMATSLTAQQKPKDSMAHGDAVALELMQKENFDLRILDWQTLHELMSNK